MFLFANLSSQGFQLNTVIDEVKVLKQQCEEMGRQMKYLNKNSRQQFEMMSGPHAHYILQVYFGVQAF